MTVYVIADITIHDRDGYRTYEAGFMEILKAHHGRALAADDQPRVVEGEWDRTRAVILSFADEAAFDAWYQSSEYQALMQHRVAASTAAILLARGIG